jgi:adenine-specific DNA methylase
VLVNRKRLNGESVLEKALNENRTAYTLRPGKYIEYDFPLREVNRLARKEANAKKPIYTMHKWWARRLSCVFRTVLLASAIDWTDWDALEPWRRDPDGDFVDVEGKKIVHERDYHKRVRDTRPSAEWYQKTSGLLERAPTAWERLYYRLDDEANQVIDRAFKGKLVLDPFMGGGTTIVEALRLGANVAGVDLNPVAWFVVKKETDGIDPEALEAAFRQVEAAVADEIRSYYKTRCPACGQTADVMYVFWVKLARCLERTCGAEVPLYNSFVLARKSGKREVPAAADGTPGMRLAEGESMGTEFLVCPACGEVYASFERTDAEGSACPACSHHTPPDLLRAGYAGHGKFTCPTCGAGNAILDAAKEQGLLSHRMYGLELYCSHCSFKGYKRPDDNDIAQYKRAQQQLEVEKPTLNLPEQQIPIGLATTVEHDLPSHGFQYWKDLFNHRQLLLLSHLGDAVLAVEDKNAREYLLLAWSAALDNYNLLCRYNTSATKVEPAFSHHAFSPKLTATEGNLWGAGFGRGSYKNQVGLVLKGLEWGQNPDDNFFKADQVYEKQDIGDGIFGSSGNCTLLCRSSEDLSVLGNAEASLIVTDPPYYGNVMYAELSDFFYVWLQTVLNGAYSDVFGESLTPKDAEVVETVTRGHRAPFLTKDEAFFTSGLTRIFEEAGKHITDDGLMVFTFHHQANEAWASVLKTVLDAGFYVVAVYPVHAEMIASLHIYDKANISYDALIVCRKQSGKPESANWRDVADRIYLRAERLVRELENGARALLPEDIYVIAIGKCLEVYSRHYYRGQSYVYWQDRPVGIAEALDGDEARGIQGIGQIVDQLVEEAEGRLWPAALDPVSRFYAVNFLGQSEVAYDRVKRRLLHNPHVTLEELERQHLVRTAGGKVKVVAETDRADYLIEKLGGLGGDPLQPTLPGLDMSPVDVLTAVDKLHLLVALDRRGALTGGLIARWGQDRTFVDLARKVAQYLDPKARNQKIYQRIADALGGRGTMRFA